jgi:hypothetical protein
MSQQLDGEPQERQRRAPRDPPATDPWAVAAAAVWAVGMALAAMVVAGMAAGEPGIGAVAAVAVAAAVMALAVMAARAAARAVAARAVAVRVVARETVGGQSVRGSTLESRASPPLSAEKLLLFGLPPHISDPIIGDLAEHFPSIQERHGVWFARAWYWRQAVGAFIRFVGPRLAGATSLGAVLSVARRLLSR